MMSANGLCCGLIVVVSESAVTVCNVALHKPTYQVSVDTSAYDDAYPAFLAVDGDRTTSVLAGSCAVTRLHVNPWWAVDLGQPMTVDYILLTIDGIEKCTRLNTVDVLGGPIKTWPPVVHILLIQPLKIQGIEEFR